MRIRTIKPEFWRSRDIAGLDHYTRLLFIGLWSYVDDNGVGKDIDYDIIGDLFASDLMTNPVETVERVKSSLTQLAEAGLIYRYEADGTPYLEIATWSRHQYINKPGKPRYPKHDEADSQNGSPVIPRGSQVNYLSIPETENPSSSALKKRSGAGVPDIVPVIPGGSQVNYLNIPESSRPGTGEQGNRGTGEQRKKKDSSIEESKEEPSAVESSPAPARDRDAVETNTAPRPVEKPPTTAPSRKHPLPGDWTPKDKHRRLAASYGLDCDLLADQFANWCRANDRRYVSFDAAFTNWIHKGAQFDADRKSKTQNMNRAQLNDLENRRLQAWAREIDRANGFAADPEPNEGALL